MCQYATIIINAKFGAFREIIVFRATSGARLSWIPGISRPFREGWQPYVRPVFYRAIDNASVRGAEEVPLHRGAPNWWQRLVEAAGKQLPPTCTEVLQGMTLWAPRWSPGNYSNEMVDLSISGQVGWRASRVSPNVVPLNFSDKSCKMPLITVERYEEPKKSRWVLQFQWQVPEIREKSKMATEATTFCKITPKLRTLCRIW